MPSWLTDKIRRVGGIVIVLGIGCIGCSGTATNSPIASPPAVVESTELDFYSVDHYDKSRDPASDLAATIQRAKTEKKNILVQVGGDWCGWCKLMTQYINTNDRVRGLVGRNYLIMKVTFESDQKNEAFLSQYPAIHGYPHLFVLDGDWKLLHSQDTSELEEGHGYSEETFLAFLEKWKPAK